ncbi:YjdF family protein [Gorillibacterium timonense]|uniref:YjdF family protein n=1 Tax=Gorillibacterium timonense TaxID=1689269 RepID=UPI00071DF410|nr:YjdF family protein [Gorillibacterium timonense]
MKLTIYHDGQYWVGILEEQDQARLKAVRFIFGSEPKDEEVLDFIRNDLSRLVDHLSQGVDVQLPESRKRNPKRVARLVSKEVRSKGVSTYAQEAMRLEYEKRKQDKQTDSKQRREAAKEFKREVKVRKAKEKHRGH